tara:strand:+ start:382 stop:564 length:183 start_codon:yes stop_codon:yes gene_type:complete
MYVVTKREDVDEVEQTILVGVFSTLELANEVIPANAWFHEIHIVKIDTRVDKDLHDLGDY